MRAHLVVVLPPLLDADPSLDAIPKPLHAQVLVAELAVERFVSAILPTSLAGDSYGSSEISAISQFALE